MLIRAVAPIHLFSPVLGEMELWEVAALLGKDIGAPPPRLIIPREPFSGDRPTGPRLAEVD